MEPSRSPSSPSPWICDHPESRAEELASFVTHAVGAALAVVALTILVVLASRDGDIWRIVSFSVFGAALVLLYVASTCYHLVSPGRWKHRLKILDHCAIYALIAGTYTPVLLVALQPHRAWGVFGALWGLTVVGSGLKMFYIHRFKLLSTAMYVAMGWVALLVIGPLFEQMSRAGIAWFLAGGVAYTGGVVFFLWDRLPFNHAIWHLFVLAGSACHFFGILWHVLPR